MIAVERTMPAIVASPVARLASLASRDAQRGDAIAANFPGCRAHGSYSALLRDREVDAVYIALPNHLHREWTVRALEAGKHVLCEKPLALSTADICEIAAVRDRTGLHVEEAFAYRNHPQWAVLNQMIAEGSIGLIVAAQSIIAKRFMDPGDIRNNPDGGGALLDLGSYAINGFNLLFRRPPTRVLGVIDRDPEFGIDRLTTAVLDYGGAQAVLQVGSQSGTDGWGTHQSLSILGTAGWLRLDFPYAQARPVECHLFHGDLSSVGNLATDTHTFSPTNQYQLQIDRFSRLLIGDDVPAWPIEDAFLTMEVISSVTKSVGEGKWIGL